MTVITYGKSVTENAKSRRHARRRGAAMDRERIESIIDAAFGIEAVEAAPAVEHHMNRIEKAVSITEQYGRQLQKAIAYHEPIAQERKEKRYREHLKVRNPLGQQVNARQKMRGKSIPLI